MPLDARPIERGRHAAPRERPGVRAGASSRVVLAAVVSGALLAGILTYRGTVAAFFGATGNSPNSWDAATVTIDADAGGAMVFNATGLLPGDGDSNCVTADYTGDVAASVSLYGGSLTDPSGLGPYLELTIEDGAGGGMGDCTGFTPSATLYSGDLTDFVTNHYSTVTGIGPWTPSGPSQRVYRISYEVAATTPNDRQGATCSAALTWQASA